MKSLMGTVEVLNLQQRPLKLIFVVNQTKEGDPKSFRKLCTLGSKRQQIWYDLLV